MTRCPTIIHFAMASMVNVSLAKAINTELEQGLFRLKLPTERKESIAMNDQTKVPVSTTRSAPTFFDIAAPISEPVNWLRTEIDRLFEDFGRPARGVFNLGARSPAPMPALDLIDDEKSYRLSAELPGLVDKDIEISVADGVLSISGEKKEQEERREKGILLSERHYGAFTRQIALPSDVDLEGIKAQFKDGILTVTLAKDEKAVSRTRKIAVEKA